MGQKNFHPTPYVKKKTGVFGAQLPSQNLTLSTAASENFGGSGRAGEAGGLACGDAYWPLALEPSAMTSRHPYYCGHPHCCGQPPAWEWGGGGRGFRTRSPAFKGDHTCYGCGSDLGSAVPVNWKRFSLRSKAQHEATGAHRFGNVLVLGPHAAQLLMQISAFGIFHFNVQQPCDSLKGQKTTSLKGLGVPNPPLLVAACTGSGIESPVALPTKKKVLQKGEREGQWAQGTRSRTFRVYFIQQDLPQIRRIEAGAGFTENCIRTNRGGLQSLCTGMSQPFVPPHRLPKSYTMKTVARKTAARRRASPWGMERA